MASVIRSPWAKRDIVAILEYTKERWGKAQAREYAELIKPSLPSRTILSAASPATTFDRASSPTTSASAADPRGTSSSIGLTAPAPWRSSGSCTTRWTSNTIFHSPRSGFRLAHAPAFLPHACRHLRVNPWRLMTWMGQSESTKRCATCTSRTRTCATCPLEATPSEYDPDRRVLIMLGARGSLVRSWQPDGNTGGPFLKVAGT